jgi:hypothetical protein
MGETSLKPLKAILETIREQADLALECECYVRAHARVESGQSACARTINLRPSRAYASAVKITRPAESVSDAANDLPKRRQELILLAEVILRGNQTQNKLEFKFCYTVSSPLRVSFMGLVISSLVKDL